MDVDDGARANAHVSDGQGDFRRRLLDLEVQVASLSAVVAELFALFESVVGKDAR